ncbi:MAG TPA: hypothetical protein VIO94_06915 [Phenylobacterium sp.]
MDRGDDAYRERRYDEAAAIYERLARFPDDRQRTAVRAKVKLARTEIRRGNATRAEQLISQVIASGDSRAAADARFLRSDLAYRRSLADADADYDRANALLEAGNLDAAESAFNALLNRGCPLEAGFYDRVRLRLANVSLERGDFAEARRRADQVNPNVSPNVAQNLARLRERIAQREIDAPVEMALEALRTRPEAEGEDASAVTDAQAKLTEVRQLAADNPRISPGLRQRLQLEESRQLARANQFAEARALAEQIRSAPANPEVGAQADAALGRIRDLEIAFNARRILAEGDALNAAGRYRAANAKYGELATGADWPEEWRQRAKLRKAGLARRMEDYRASSALIAEVEAAPASDSLRLAATEARASYNEAAPINDLRGGFNIGLRHDTDAAAVASAAQDEDEEGTGFLAGVEYPDDALVWGGNLEYRRKLNDRYDYFMVSGGLSGVEQFDLNEIDRVNFTVRAGPVFRIPSQAAQAGGGLYFYEHWRGGEELHTNLGVWGQYRRQLEGFEARVSGTAAKRDDVRDVFDAWRYGLNFTVEPNSDDGYGPRLAIDYGYRGAKDDSRASWLLGGGGGYRFPIGELADRRVSGDVYASYTRVQYLGDRVLSPGVIGEREDDRLRLGIAAELEVDEDTFVRVGYERLNNESNLPSQDRDNNQFGISLRRNY